MKFHKKLCKELYFIPSAYPNNYAFTQVAFEHGCQFNLIAKSDAIPKYAISMADFLCRSVRLNAVGIGVDCVLTSRAEKTTTTKNVKAYVKIGGNNVNKYTIAFLVVSAVYGLVFSGNTWFTSDVKNTIQNE